MKEITMVEVLKNEKLEQFENFLADVSIGYGLYCDGEISRKELSERTQKLYKHIETMENINETLASEISQELIRIIPDCNSIYWDISENDGEFEFYIFCDTNIRILGKVFIVSTSTVYVPWMELLELYRDGGLESYISELIIDMKRKAFKEFQNDLQEDLEKVRRKHF